MNISAFRLKTYLQCPLKYRYHYVQGLGNAYSSESIALNFSNLIHDIIFEIIELRTNDFDLARIVAAQALKNGISESALLKRAREVVGRYLEGEPIEDEIIGNNINLKLRWNGDDFFVKIDRLDRDEGGLLTMTDYKTGKYLPSSEELAVDIQFGLYRVLIEEKYNSPVKKIVWDNIVLDERIEADRENLLGYEDIRKIIKGFKKDLERSRKSGYEAKPGGHCRFCDFRVICNHVDEDVRTLVGEDPILGDLYRLNEMVRELSGILDIDKLLKKIEEKFIELTGLTKVKISLDIPADPPPKSEGFILTSGVTELGVLETDDLSSLSLKKEALINSFISQSGIFINNAILYKKANSDGMTGFYHQAYLKNYLDELIFRGDSFCLIIFDLDHFKTVNDAHGHLSGDRVLLEFTSILKESIRLEKNDILSRYGGEEFAVIMTGKDIKTAYSVAERIRKKTQKHNFVNVDGDNLKITVSGGVNCYPGGGESTMTLIENCDRALYLSKEDGRNRISIYTKENENE